MFGGLAIHTRHRKMRSHAEEPQWVLVGDALHNVSEFAHLLPTCRPKACCPICTQAVILKLGDIRVHHYAHEPDVKCNANNPETALHLNTKFHIYNELQKGEQLKVEKTCSGGCGKKKESVWAEHWREAKVEFSIHPVRPDIVLLGIGSTIGAIEVFASHAVDKQKTEQLKKQGLRWMEIKASESIYHGDKAWRIEQPLPHLRIQPDSDAWKCEECVAAEKRRAEKPVQVREVKGETLNAYPTVEREAVCEFCVNRTSDWWYHDTVSGICKCRSCYRQGRY